MSNMSYCRFQNTVGDLRDCYDAMGDDERMSFEEQLARWHLIRLCRDIMADYGDEADNPRPVKA